MHHHKSTISEHDVMFCTTITALGVCRVWQYGLWSFQTGGIKLMGASEVLKNQSFKNPLFSSSQKKKYLKLKSWLNFNAIIVFY